MAIPSTHVSLLRELEDGPATSEAWAEFHARYRDVILRWCPQPRRAAQTAPRT